MIIRRFLLITLLGFSCVPALAMTLIPLNLQQLAQRADIIFEGQCVKNETRIDAQTKLVATFTTFNVTDIIKGQLSDEYTIKQIGGSLPESNLVHKIHGVPSFTAGEDYVVFMPAPSPVSGFSSPLGMMQGKFHIRNINGQKSVGNGRNINALINRPSANKRGTINSVHKLLLTKDRPDLTSLTSFKQHIRELAAN